MLSRRKFIGLATMGGLTMALSPVLSACSQTNTGGSGSPSTNSTDTTGSQVIICMTPGNEPSAGFDPFFGWGCGEHSHEPLIQSTLITTTIDMGFKNDLATAYDVSPDGMSWTFSIREDVKFTDGQALTAADVAYTINGIKDFDGSEIDLSMIDKVLAKDNKTVEIVMKRPHNALLYSLAVIGIVPEHAHDAGYGSHPIGSGRYLLEQWDHGQQVIFRANPDYYGEAPLMQRVSVVFLEEAAALAAVKAGQVDIANTSAVYSDQSIDGYDILACKSVDSRGISLPTKPPGNTNQQGDTVYPVGNSVTCDLAIRRALNHLVDRDSLVKNVLNGYGTVAFSVSDGMPWSSPDMRVAYSEEEATRILADGGWTAGSDGILEKNGIRASFELCHPANDSVRQSLANELANQARQVGIDIQIRGLSWDDIYPRMYADPILWGWGSNSPMELYNLYYSKSSSNFASYENKVIDGYLDAALATPTVAESFPLWQKAQWDGTVGVAPQGEATWVWLANIDHLYFKRYDLVVAKQKLHPHGHGWSLANNVDQWTWK